jgi:L-alanine-DL-glutamate epimerase-like enolase superfamily enzyme
MGLGEGWCDQTRIADFFTCARAVVPDLLGRDLHKVASHAKSIDFGNWADAAVASAVDIALWDMRARRSGLPLHRAIGASRLVVPAYASGGLYADQKDGTALAAEMRGYARNGFTSFKMKIGALGLDADLDRVRAVRAILGPQAEIIVDAVGQLTRAAAPDWFARLHALGVRAIQMPLPREDVDGMAALQRLGLLDVVADETEFRPDAFQRLLDKRAVGWLQFNPGLAGGISGGMALIASASAAGVPVTLQCHATAVMQATCLHLAAMSQVRSAEFHMFHDHLRAWLPSAMRTVQDGRITLGSEPGLGIDPAFLDGVQHGPGTVSRVFSVPD